MKIYDTITVSVIKTVCIKYKRYELWGQKLIKTSRQNNNILAYKKYKSRLTQIKAFLKWTHIAGLIIL